MRILLVEDDLMIGAGIRRGLRQDEFTVDWAQDGRAAELAIDNGVYDLLVLDLGLPKKDGFDVLTQLRHRGEKMPVLVVTARTAVADRIKGLDAGADDYLAKPFDLDELVARVRALLRRHSGRADPVIRCGKLSCNFATHEVCVEDQRISLSAREFSRLEALLDRPGAVLSRERLEEKLYGWDDEVQSNTVEVYIHALRKKLGQGLIKNLRGIGYWVPTDQ